MMIFFIFCKILELSAFHYDELRRRFTFYFPAAFFSINDEFKQFSSQCDRAGKLNMNKINFAYSARRRRAAMECEKKCLYGKNRFFIDFTKS
jgi:hypothetical protein